MAKCKKCRKADMVSTSGPFEYEQAKLPYQVLLLDVPIRECPACGETTVTIPDPEGLHRAICLLITEADRVLHPEEVRFLRKFLDWSAEQLAATMGVDKKTISRWENGKQKMGPVAERLLRLLIRQRLSPDPGALVDNLFPQLAHSEAEHLAPMRLASHRKGWKQAA